MFVRRMMTSVLLVVSFVTTTFVGRTSHVHAHTSLFTQTLHPIHTVSIKPPYGKTDGRIRIHLSDSEWRIVKLLEPITHLPEGVENLPNDTIHWVIEDSAAQSETLRLGIRALQDTRKLFALGGIQEQDVTVVVGRTQTFIKNELEKLNCFPDLRFTHGVFVMGAALCNYTVIVINLSGYLFYRSANQTITSSMEQRAEPMMSNTSYLIVDRNISGLSHEWTHIARGILAEGYIPPDEPAWFREGFAEIVSGFARASSFNNKLNYMGFHVIRLRQFSVWPTRCALPLYQYRKTSKEVSGCEYLRGATAIELLIAYHGGLQRVFNVYRDLVETNDFTQSFRRIYGFSLSSFELVADRYASYINKAARYDH